jgi:uncharacterized spore protein YtfJ
MDERPVADIEPIEDMLKRLNVSAVFGEPVRQGDAVVIPVARVAYGFGYGSGYGRGTPPAPASEQGTAGGVGECGGAGGGGGGGGVAVPLGALRITADGVKYEAVMDLTRISLAGIALSVWSVFWIAKTVRAFVRR